MPRWFWFAPLAALTLLLALGLYRIGREAQQMTEADVIRAIAERDAIEHEGAQASCFAVPGEGEIWVVVQCGSDPARRYPVDRAGRLVRGAEIRPET